MTFADLWKRLTAQPIEFEICRLEIGADDILVLKAPYPLTEQQADNIKATVHELSPEIRTLILDKGFDLAVLTDRSLKLKKCAA